MPLAAVPSPLAMPDRTAVQSTRRCHRADRQFLSANLANRGSLSQRRSCRRVLSVLSVCDFTRIASRQEPLSSAKMTDQSVGSISAFVWGDSYYVIWKRAEGHH